MYYNMLLRLIIEIAFVATISNSKPISVEFGTNDGPIIPPKPSTTTMNPLAPKNPAPVHEKLDDVPAPQYRPPTPNQYRNLISQYTPNANIQLGTALDIKYQNLNTVSQLQVQQQKAAIAEQEGFGYRGAQVFNVQEYQFEEASDHQQEGVQSTKKLTNAQQFVEQYVPKQQRQVRSDQNENDTQKASQVNEGQHEDEQTISQTPNAGNYQLDNKSQYVSAIGIVYSSGLRYYVPQIYYYDSHRHQQEDDGEHQDDRHHDYNELRDNGPL